MVADGWNYRLQEYYDFRQSLLLCTTIDEIRNLLPAFTKIHSEKRLTKKFQKSTMSVMVSETIKELGRKLKISVSPLAPPGIKTPAEAMKEDPNQLNPWLNVVQTERMEEQAAGRFGDMMAAAPREFHTLAPAPAPRRDDNYSAASPITVPPPPGWSQEAESLVKQVVEELSNLSREFPESKITDPEAAAYVSERVEFARQRLRSLPPEDITAVPQYHLAYSSYNTWWKIIKRYRIHRDGEIAEAMARISNRFRELQKEVGFFECYHYSVIEKAMPLLSESLQAIDQIKVHDKIDPHFSPEVADSGHVGTEDRESKTSPGEWRGGSLASPRSMHSGRDGHRGSRRHEEGHERGA